MQFILSPFTLFLILLIVIFISYFIGNWFPSPYPNEKENFISFDYGASIGSSIQIPNYSGNSPINKVAKVYDNVFYDVYNGNLIEVDGTKYNGNSEITGNSISNIYVSSRSNAGKPVVKYNTRTSEQTNESKSTFTNSFSEFVYKTQCINTNPYVVFYLPWNDSTYIHMIDISGTIQTHNHVITELYYQTTQSAISYNNSTLKFFSAKSMDDFNSNNNKFVVLSSYDPSYSIYQMSSQIFFDLRNGQVIITNPDTNTISVYPRKYDMTSNSLIQSDKYIAQTSVISTDFNTWTAYDLSSTKGNKMILYISIATKTMLVIIEPDNNNSYRIFNIKRFLNTGLDNGQSSITTTTSSNTNTTTSTPETMMDDYYKWFYHSAVKGIQDPNSHMLNYSDDYILKTQIVPPVCPSCPSCNNHSGTCVNCGGNGGGGTGQPLTNTVNATTGVVNNAVNDVTGVASNTVTGATSLANNALNTSGNLLYAGASGTKDFVQDTASGTKDFVQDSASGAINLAKSIGTGITNLGNPTDINTNVHATTNNNRNFNDNDINRLGYHNSSGGPIINNSSVTDPYSYFGAVPSKENKFMPITSDFSKFGR